MARFLQKKKSHTKNTDKHKPLKNCPFTPPKKCRETDVDHFGSSPLSTPGFGLGRTDSCKPVVIILSTEKKKSRLRSSLLHLHTFTPSHF